MPEINYPKLNDIKSWSPEIETQITKQWQSRELFNFNQKTKKKIYSIDTPPPYINAPVHIGQAITYCYMDFFARYQRMKGKEVIFPLGLDRNGLPIEMAAEKKFNADPFKVGREKFIAACKKLLEETSSETTDTFSKLGISFTSYKQGDHIGAVYETDSPKYRQLTQSTFIRLYKKGLIYEDTRINNWDSKLQTTIADSEIEYKDIPSTFNHIKWKVKETGEEIIIATTRPELICTCGVVIFHPTDKRYNRLNNKTAISPLFNKEITIKEHPLADPKKGTGIVMMCSAGDLSDIQFFREQKLEPKIAINKNGTMNEKADFLEGLSVREARERVIEKLKQENLLIKQENILHRTPISERSGVEIEFIEMPEFYCKQLNYKKDIKNISKEMTFYPPEALKLLTNWIDSIAIDWPISRRRFYGTPIPLWYAGDLVAIPPEDNYYTPWEESPPKDSEVYQNKKSTGKKVKDFPKIKWNGETRILDTWMDSSVSELYILEYGKNPEFFKKAYPAALRPQGKDIIRTWLYYTILRGYLETGKPCFKDVWINQHIVDEKGYKMSKSKGNIINPQELLKEYGAEAIRMWSSIEGDLTKKDFNCSKEKIKAEIRTLNKLINIAKFIFQFKKPEVKPNLTELDSLFVDYIEDLTLFTDNSYEKYDFHQPALKLRHFLWEILASHYLEIVKNRAYNQEKMFSEEESNSAKYTLHYLLERLLILIYPILPQITSTISKESSINLLESEFPRAKSKKSDISLVNNILEFNSKIWKIKKDKGISLKEPIQNIEIPKELKIFEKDLKACHKI